MRPVKFKHLNVEFGKNQDEYNTLPALRLDTPQGEVISCWKISFKERIKILFFGRVWLSLMSFNKPLNPSYMSVNRKDVYSHSDDSVRWQKLFLDKLHKLCSNKTK